MAEIHLVRTDDASSGELPQGARPVISGGQQIRGCGSWSPPPVAFTRPMRLESTRHSEPIKPGTSKTSTVSIIERPCGVVPISAISAIAVASSSRDPRGHIRVDRVAAHSHGSQLSPRPPFRLGGRRYIEAPRRLTRTVRPGRERQVHSTYGPPLQ